jgi:hypothetical protein
LHAAQKNAAIGTSRTAANRFMLVVAARNGPVGLSVCFYFRFAAKWARSCRTVIAQSGAQRGFEETSGGNGFAA